jgi:hypothetical protein
VIKCLCPKISFVLGSTTKKAPVELSEIPEFSDCDQLRSHEVTEDYEKVLFGYRIILSVYSGKRRKVKYGSRIRQALSKMKSS